MVDRRLARECVLQGLYAHSMGGGDRAHVEATVLLPKLQSEVSVWAFAQKLFSESLEVGAEADRLIAKHAANWPLGRVALLDRLIMRIAVCEFLRFESIPPKVSINEAIEIAKSFSTERSGVFINGVLDAMVGELLEKGLLKKSGRGLVGMESLLAKHARPESSNDSP